MKKVGLFVVLAFAFAVSFAQTTFTAEYKFDYYGSLSNVQSFSYNGNPIIGINMGNLNKVGVDSWTDKSGFSAVNWPQSATADTDKYISFNMTAAAGYEFTVTDITFGICRDGAGIQKTEWRGSKDGYTTPFKDYSGLTQGLTHPSNAGVLVSADWNTYKTWSGIILSFSDDDPNNPSKYKDITDCGFRMYMYDAEPDSDICFGGLHGSVKISGTYQPAVSNPVWNISPGAVSDFTYIEGRGPSNFQRFCVGGSNLAGTITVTTSDNFPMSVGGNPTNTLLLTHPNGSILQDIYVNLKGNLPIGDYAGYISVQYSGATKTIPLSGSVIPPPPGWYCVDFEGIGETKPLHNEGELYLSGIKWSLDGVKIAPEPINGSRRAHFQGYGTSSMTMKEEKVDGVCEISFKYQRYGSGDPVSWVVDYSTDGGQEWTQIGDPFTPEDSEQTFEATVSKTGNIMVCIRRHNGMGADMILDDLMIVDHCDFLNNKPKQVGENLEYTVTVTGGNGNYDSLYQLDTGTVFDFNVAFHKYITLTREGPWTITTAVQEMNQDLEYFTAYKYNEDWIILPMPEGVASYEINPYRSSAAAPGTELIIGSTEKQQDNPPTTPVTLSHFSATVTAQNYVNLSWVSQTETNLMGYNVLRSADEDLINAIQICAMIQGTNTSEAQTYTYLDKDLVEDGTYYYWLQSVDMGGTTAFHGPASVVFSITGGSGAPSIPTMTQLGDAYPNPFNPSTTLRYQLESPGKVKIDIYNQRGQLVRSFEKSHDAAGYYTILWDGRDGNGRALASGVYLYRMTCGEYSGVKKMVLQK